MAERRLGTLRHIVFILKTCMLKDPQHWIFGFQGTVKLVLFDPFTLQRTFFERISGSLKKFF